jgi:hypothetical protein
MATRSREGRPPGLPPDDVVLAAWRFLFSACSVDFAFRHAFDLNVYPRHGLLE